MTNAQPLPIEEKWKKEKEEASALEKVYEGQKKKGEAGFLNPDKLDSELLDQLPEQCLAMY